MRVAIVDDEVQERETMRSYLERFATETGNAIEADLYPSGDALLAEYKLVYDIILFDIDMPGTNGIETARKVREQDEGVTILFVTNIAQYAINAFEVEAVDYIIKPVEFYDFAMKFRRAVKKAAQRSDRDLLLDTVDGHVRVAIPDITYVEGFDHYLVYHVRSNKGGPDTEHQIRGNMRDHESMLKPYGFCRTHRSYLVNAAWIDVIHANDLIVAGTEIPIGRSYKRDLMQDYFRSVRG